MNLHNLHTGIVFSTDYNNFSKRKPHKMYRRMLSPNKKKVRARAKEHTYSSLGVATTVFVNTKYRPSMLKRTMLSAVLTHWSCYTRSSNLTGSTLDSRETRDSWLSFLTSRSLSTGHSALWNKRVETSITLQWEQMVLGMGKVSIGRNGTSQKIALEITVNEWI